MNIRQDGRRIVIVLDLRILRRFAIATALSLVLGVPAWLLAGTLNVPHEFVNGEIADAEEMNANFAAVKESVDDNDTRIEALEKTVASIDLDGDTLMISGVNVQIVDGTGDTAGAPNGLGNLIIGYNEGTHDRSGSHNLVVGTEHSYTSYGGLVAGFGNTVSARSTSVSGGRFNSAVAEFASVGGGSGRSAVASSEWGVGCPNNMALVGSICVDRYESSVWSSPDGGTQYGATEDDYPCDDDGQDCTDIYARSVTGVRPSVAITYFQAQQACANVGKRLLTNSEWQMAVAGTPEGNPCAVSTVSPLARVIALTGCRSNYGTFDMVGNVGEWVAEWVPRSTAAPGWGDFSDDFMSLAGASVEDGPGGLIRGGTFRPGGAPGGDGPFYISAGLRPDGSDLAAGFRCAR
jgi:hypothetical protein